MIFKPRREGFDLKQYLTLSLYSCEAMLFDYGKRAFLAIASERFNCLLWR